MSEEQCTNCKNFCNDVYYEDWQHFLCCFCSGMTSEDEYCDQCEKRKHPECKIFYNSIVCYDENSVIFAGYPQSHSDSKVSDAHQYCCDIFKSKFRNNTYVIKYQDWKKEIPCISLFQWIAGYFEIKPDQVFNFCPHCGKKIILILHKRWKWTKDHVSGEKYKELPILKFRQDLLAKTGG